jgi:transcriptional regulator with XRE-family HTH domain
MSAYGYDFHQTTIAKIEAAQRPLRVRELADFAALYGVEVQELIYAPSRSLLEIDQEIDEIEQRLAEGRMIAAKAREEADTARATGHRAEAQYALAVANVTVLEGRLSALRADKEDLSHSESGSGPLSGKGSMESGQNAPGLETSPGGATAENSPTVLRTLLGSQLRRLREARGITADQAARGIRSSQSKISRLELGRIALYGVTENAERLKFLELTRKSNTPDWWQEYSDILPDWFEAFIALEMAAIEMQIYEAQYVPDLLQTGEYSRIVTSRNYEISSRKEIERTVQLQAARKERLLERRNPPHLHIVLDEVALARQVGSEAVMHAQLEHIAEIAKQPNVAIQVLPLQAQRQPTEGFRILRFGEAELPDMVYMQQLTSAIYLDRYQEVEIYRKAMRQLSKEAYPPEASAKLLNEILSA